MKRLLVCILTMALCLTGCGLSTGDTDGTKIKLSDDKITVDGWKISDDETKDVYAANDIVYYPEGKDFKFGEGEKADEHSQKEADSHTVVHITKPGKYELSGELSAGQIAVDLGEDAEDNPEAVVTLVLNDVDIACSVAPAVIFYNVYECGDDDEEKATKDVDTSKAGANVIIADGTENNINGSYVAKIYESYKLDDTGTEVVDSEKLHKYDGAFYSKKSININGGEIGDGILNIKAENEGLDSELHLTINGGNINITSGNDGINTNEDNVSVTTVNGGNLNIICDGSTGEGDGIDSNGWLVINGGNITAQACATSGDAGIDSDKGIDINGGNVVASGNMLDHISGGEQNYAVFNFQSRQTDKESLVLKNSENKEIGKYSPKNDFTYLLVSNKEMVEGEYTLWDGEKQLSAIAVENLQNQVPTGDVQTLPDNMDGNPPKNMENPPNDIGNPPEKPGNMENQGGHNPQSSGDRGNNPVTGEKSTTFKISKGGNYFANVA